MFLASDLGGYAAVVSSVLAQYDAAKSTSSPQGRNTPSKQPKGDTMANGIIIIDKPADWTSMDVCAKLRGILKTKKVGHAGTLDPMATGVLPVFVGQATRGVSFAESGEKEYVATLRLGLVTDTQDTSGRTLETHPVAVTMDDVAAALPRFTGAIQQIPPMYSAIKINGQKLYDLARQGRKVERNPQYPEDFDRFYDAISAPVDSHTVVMPHGQENLTFDAVVTSGQVTYSGILGNRRYWKGLQVNFSPLEPQRTT